MSNEIVGSVGNITFQVDAEAAAQLSAIHGIDVEAEIRAAIAKQLAELTAQYPNAPVTQGEVK